MLPAPSTLRETVLLFGRLRGGQDVAALFAQVDWSGISRRQLVHAFLDRPPENAAEAVDGLDFNAQIYALELFGSAGFRLDLPQKMLRHFPARRRALFVHIPKAAGSDFVSAMHRKLPTVSIAFGDPELVPRERLARRLADFAKAVAGADSIFMGSHTKLSWYLDSGLYRFGDRLITILRHPHEICISLANYIVGRFLSTPDLSAQDTRIWAATLRLTASEIAALEPRVLALALVARPGFQPINPICSLLGDGTAAGVFDNLQRAPVEITTMRHYGRWLKEDWGIERDKRANASVQLIGWNDLSVWQKSQIEEGCSEDRIVYDAVTDALASTPEATSCMSSCVRAPGSPNLQRVRH